MLLLILVHNKCITYVRHNQDKKSQRSAKTNDAEPALHFPLFLLGIFANFTLLSIWSTYFK